MEKLHLGFGDVLEIRVYVGVLLFDKIFKLGIPYIRMGWYNKVYKAILVFRK